jgi:uncharacterized RmlC-like cupin family protein
MPRIEVVHGPDLKKGETTPGILREKAFESSHVLVSRTRLDRGAVSGWHHHGTHDLYGFMVSGQLRLEYGPNGSEAAVVNPGDFFHVPPGVVHRDVNPDRAQGLVVVNILVGSGVPVVNVEGV